VGHGQQLGRERIEVGLVAELGAERLDDLGRVVAVAVEAPVDGVLEPRRAGWNRAATDRVAPDTARLGGLPSIPSNS
jgi:hypothetical protein